MTREQAIALLEELGRDSDQVAASLENLKIRGIKESSLYCPISQFMRKRGASSCSTNSGKLYVGLLPEDDFREVVFYIQTPHAIDSFILNFDAGYYPALEM